MLEITVVIMLFLSQSYWRSNEDDGCSVCEAVEMARVKVFFLWLLVYFNFFLETATSFFTFIVCMMFDCRFV